MLTASRRGTVDENLHSCPATSQTASHMHCGLTPPAGFGERTMVNIDSEMYSEVKGCS